MKNTFKMMWVLMLGAGLFTMSSCTDDNEDPEPNGNGDTTETTCYATKVVSTDEDGDDTYEYEYNADNQVVKSTNTYEGDSYITVFEYKDGKLDKAIGDDTDVSQFIYENGGDIPSRINTTFDGEDAYFTVITTENGNITKIENSYYDDSGDAVLEDVTTLTYENGVITRSLTETYDPDSETFETDIDLQDIVLDGKKTPYNGQIAFAFEDGFNVLAILPSNVLSANIVGDDGAGGELKIPYTSTFTYNDNDYPNEFNVSLFTFTTTTKVTYDCK